MNYCKVAFFLPASLFTSLLCKTCRAIGTKTMQSYTLQSQLDPASILCHESAGNASVSPTSPESASFNSGPTVVGGLDGLDGVPNDIVHRSNALSPFELPINSAVQPATHHPREPEFKAVKRPRRPPRAVSACSRCRVRKTKCDEGKPQYFNC
jgi:Fungal Zn(2)-Cys(6) binuclear cluster domain